MLPEKSCRSTRQPAEGAAEPQGRLQSENLQGHQGCPGRMRRWSPDLGPRKDILGCAVSSRVGLCHICRLGGTITHPGLRGGHLGKEIRVLASAPKTWLVCWVPLLGSKCPQRTLWAPVSFGSPPGSLVQQLPGLLSVFSSILCLPNSPGLAASDLEWG